MRPKAELWTEQHLTEVALFRRCFDPRWPTSEEDKKALSDWVTRTVMNSTTSDGWQEWPIAVGCRYRDNH